MKIEKKTKKTINLRLLCNLFSFDFPQSTGFLSLGYLPSFFSVFKLFT